MIDFKQFKKGVLLGLLLVGFFVAPGIASAHSHRNWQPTPTPTPISYDTPTKCVTPPVSPSPIIPTPPIPSIPVPSSAPTPTTTPIPTTTPVPTSTPVSTNSGGSSPTPQGQISTTQAPGSPSCTVSFASPNLFYFHANGNGNISVAWNETASVDHYSAIYGYSPTNLEYGIPSFPSNGQTEQELSIGGLIPGNSVWVQIWGWQNGCAQKSNVFDPLVL